MKILTNTKLESILFLIELFKIFKNNIFPYYDKVKLYKDTPLK